MPADGANTTRQVHTFVRWRFRTLCTTKAAPNCMVIISVMLGTIAPPRPTKQKPLTNTIFILHESHLTDYITCGRAGLDTTCKVDETSGEETAWDGAESLPSSACGVRRRNGSSL